VLKTPDLLISPPTPAKRYIGRRAVISDATPFPPCTLNNPVVILAIIGLSIMTVLLIFKVKSNFNRHCGNYVIGYPWGLLT
jgi:xanthine/uracil/vitamin C permease (AzgA family)